MSPISELKFRFSDAVYAIGTTPKSLRKWLQAGQAARSNDEERKGWHSFDFVDIALLAVMRKCVDYGLPVEAAKAVAVEQLKVFGPLLGYKNTPSDALVAIWMNRVLLVWLDGETYQQKIVNNWSADHHPAESYIVIDVATLLRKAFDRAIESASDGAAD